MTEWTSKDLIVISLCLSFIGFAIGYDIGTPPQPQWQYDWECVEWDDFPYISFGCNDTQLDALEEEICNEYCSKRIKVQVKR